MKFCSRLEENDSAVGLRFEMFDLKMLVFDDTMLECDGPLLLFFGMADG